jgi:hypothetical protein
MRCSNSPRRIRMIDCRTLTQAWSTGVVGRRPQARRPRVSEELYGAKNA